MQLSFLDDIPEYKKVFFVDVFAEALLDVKSNKMKLITIEGQMLPQDMKVSIASKYIANFPEGTIYKIDTKLVQKKGKKPYFVALKGKTVQRAIEYFEYNLKVQFGFDFDFKKSRNSLKKVN
jgi:hypothetical protein